MTVNLMSGTIKFDKPIDFKRHYISLGGFSVNLTGSEEAIEFDFETFEGAIDNGDPCLLHFLLRGLDFDSFPDSKKLLSRVNDISSFEEFFVFTGDDIEEEEIVPLYLEKLMISFNGGDNEREFSDNFIELIPITSNGELHSYGIYDLQQKVLREDEYESYIDALINFGTLLRERMVEEEEEEYKASTSKLSLHNALEAAGYQIVERVEIES